MLVVMGLAYGYAENYEPPLKKDRVWPDVPPAAATMATLVGMNVVVYLLWKFPPAWRMLNRYFINVTLYPRALGIVGCIFSHQNLKHLATNMAVLWYTGTRCKLSLYGKKRKTEQSPGLDFADGVARVVHDDIGRGNFLALYMVSGVVGSMTSLTTQVLLGRLTTSSLGASVSVLGVIAAWLTIHSK